MSDIEKFEHYEVQKREDGSLYELGRGAMGITYKAFDTDLHCAVALKVIHPDILRSEDAQQRFLREARSAAQLRHPNIAAVFRLGKTADGTHYYAMEFCEGRTLHQVIAEEGALSCARALDIALQVTKALIVAEERNLVHRDLKPSNLILTIRRDEGEVVKVIDFGLAKSTAAEAGGWSSMGTQGFIGTAHFASPEQIEDRPVDTRSDIYSLGATLWFMLSGHPPFEGSLARIMSLHLTSEPDYTKLAGQPEGVIELLRRMLQKDAVQRPQTALELRGELETLLDQLERVGTPPPVLTADPTPETPAEPVTIPTPPAPPSSKPGGLAQPPPSTPVEMEMPTIPPSAPVTPPAPSGPPPLPIPEPPKLPTLLDLLRARGALTPAEVLRLGDELALILDAERPAHAAPIKLVKQQLTVHFRDTSDVQTARDRLRLSVTGWPAFTIAISGSQDEPIIDDTPASMATIVPENEASGDKVQQLGRLVYELLGGHPGPRFAPLASLGEAGNIVLKNAVSTGLGAFASAEALVGALRPSSSASAPPVIPPRPATTPPVQSPSTPPSTPPSSTPPVPPKPEPLPPNYNPPPYRPPEPLPAKRGFPVGLVIGGGLSLLLITVVLAFALRPKIVKRDDPTPAPYEERRTSPPPAPVTDPTPKPSTPKSWQLAPSPQPKKKEPAKKGPVQFTIHDALGDGQIAETVQVALNGKPVGILAIHSTKKSDTLVITAPSAGTHTVTLIANTVLTSDFANSQCSGKGSVSVEVKGGENFDLTAQGLGNGPSFEIYLTPRSQ